MLESSFTEWIQHKEILFYVLVAFSILLSRVPVIGKFIKCVNTLIHESGHAFAALLTSGSVLNVELFSDTSGAATTSNSSWLGKVIVSVSGYLFSSAIAFLLFFFIKQQYFLPILYFFLTLCLINLIFWVRNLYGVIWILVFGGLCGGVIYLQEENITYISIIVISTIVFSDALISTLELLYISVFQPKRSSDAVNLAKITWIPAFIWALLFVSQALAFAYSAVNLFL